MACAKVALDAYACHTESSGLSKYRELQQGNVEGLISPQSLICPAFTCMRHCGQHTIVKEERFVCGGKP